MKTDSSSQHPVSPQYGPGSDAYLYVFHQRMLARYGIAYVCEHPEVLFDPPVIPRADPDQRTYGRTPGGGTTRCSENEGGSIRLPATGMRASSGG